METRGIKRINEVLRDKVTKVLVIFEEEHKEIADITKVTFGLRSLREVTGDQDIPDFKSGVCTPILDEETEDLKFEVYMNLTKCGLDLPITLAHELGHAVATYQLENGGNLDFLANTNVGYANIVGTTAVQEIFAEAYSIKVIKKFAPDFCQKEKKRLLKNTKDFAKVMKDNGNIMYSPEDFVKNSDLIGLAIAMGCTEEIRVHFSRFEQQFDKLVEVVRDLSKFNIESLKEIMRGE